ncbi:MAG: permease-like cell division protein FtsX [Patescibacteria group bacterium]|jgi:cell division transport system permease protein
MISFIRALKFALQSFYRNIWLSVATVLILVLTLFSVSLVGMINVIGNRAVASIKDKVDVSVYFQPEVPESTVQSVQAKLQAVNGVRDVEYINRDEAQRRFLEKYQNDPVIQETLKILEDNPFGATLVIRANDFNDYPVIISALSDPEYKDLIENRDFQDYTSIINRLDHMTDRLYQVAMIVTIIFVIIAILVIFNTIRITIYTHREEIGIMRLVGATNWFIRGPFILESVLYAIISTVVSLLIFYPFLRYITPQVSSFFEGYNMNLTAYFSQYMLDIVGLQLIVALILSVGSSMIAISRHLKV